MCFWFCFHAHLWFCKSCLKCFNPGKKRTGENKHFQSRSYDGRLMQSCSGKGPPKGFPFTVFLHVPFSPLAEAGLADLAEPCAEWAGFHLFRSDQTSLTSAALWRNHQMKVREFHYVHLSKCWGGAKTGLKSKAAEGEEPHSCDSLSGGSPFRGAGLKCCVPLNSWGTAAPWGAPCGFTASESNPV